MSRRLLDGRKEDAGTINQRLAAVRRLAYEAADFGLLSQELAAGIRRVKGVKRLRSRLGNWLSSGQATQFLEKADGEDLRSVRDLAMMAVLLGCGLRRAELSALNVEDMQNRQGRWPMSSGNTGRLCLPREHTSPHGQRRQIPLAGCSANRSHSR